MFDSREDLPEFSGLRNVSIRRNVNLSDPEFKDTVKEDLASAIASCSLAIDNSLYVPLLVQSVLGHAQNGHKLFCGVSYPDATLHDIILGAGLDLEEILNRRQALIDEYIDWLELVKKDQTDRLVIKGKPLFGFLPFLDKEYTITPEFVIKATILDGLMDSYEWRMKTLDRFDQIAIDGGLFTLGAGESYLVDVQKLKELNISIEELAKKEITEKTIAHLKDTEIITNLDNPNAQVVYLRRRSGLGTTDDGSFIWIGRKYLSFGTLAARSAFYAGFCIDACDTYDKGVARPISGGYDEMIAKNLRAEFPDMVSDDEITSLIFYIAKDNGEKLVSSSHKRLVQSIDHLDPVKPTITHHFDFLIDEKPIKGFRVGFERLASKTFYKRIARRIEHYEKHNW